ncbi:MAG: hypothetical protein M0Z51_08580 [Propionibacterium sp.]|nr:hypothetical protein [Propionibacterium sp.]
MDTRQNLHDAAVLWVLDGQYQRVIDAAIGCIEADIASIGVDVLAGSSPGDPYSERLDMVGEALDELGLPLVPADPDELAREGARILARSLTRGDLTGADLGSWLTGSLTCETRARVETAFESAG